MEFAEVLAAHGFRESDERRVSAGRSTQYVASPNRYMTYTVHTYEDGTALFSWEFAIADYLATLGIQVGTSESLNQFLYPSKDVRGPQDGIWLTSAIEQVELTLASIRFDAPE
jgi:hypothetical protein